MSVSLDRNIAKELISFKLRSIQAEISSILEIWHYSSIEDFINDVKLGKLKEAENDAIDIRHLAEEQDNLMKLLDEIRT